MKPPGLEPRRFGDFEKELRERARAWIPSWGLEDGERDFGRTLLEIAARFSSEVAERLDRASDKMARGFLDWLAVRGEAARPARMPVVFKLADTAKEPVQAPHPVRMQVDARGANVTFETEADVRLVPGRLDLIIGVDPTKDAFFLPAPGLSNLDPLEPLPTQWRLKSFASPGAKILQLDPGSGLMEDMLVEIGGQQYRISNPKDDLATIDPAVPAGDGFAIDTLVTKVEAFYPFERARDQQNHLLYLGHADLFNIEAQATIDVIGVQSLGSGVSWEYWGKGKDKNAPTTDAEPRWRELTPAEANQQKADALVLRKPNGAIESRKVGTAESRWIRARKAHLDGSEPSLTVDDITLRINAKPATPPAVATVDPAALPPVEAIVNTTPSPTNDFYPLGREPRMFDSLYLGCAEAFSKKGAAAEVQFDLVEPSFSAMDAIDAGSIGRVLAGVDKTGALHLLRINADGTLSRLPGREPMVPPGEGVRLSSADFRPVMWMEGSILQVAVVAGEQVWVWKEVRPAWFLSRWESLGSPPSNTDPKSKVRGLVAINRRNMLSNVDERMLVALRDKRLSIRAAQGGTVWDPLAADKPAATPLEIEAITQVRHEDASKVSDSLLAVAVELPPKNLVLYAVTSESMVDSLFDKIAMDVVPFAIQRTVAGPMEAVAVEDGTRKLLARKVGGASVVIVVGGTHTVADTAIDGRIEGGQLTAYFIAKSVAVPPDAADLLTWIPFDPEVNAVVFGTRSDPSVGSPRGGLTLFDTLAYVPGSNESEVLAVRLAGKRSRFDALGTDFRSALVVADPMPVISNGDTIAPDVGLRPTPAIVTATAPVDGRGPYANRSFIWLDHWLDRPTGSGIFRLYQTSPSGAHFKGKVTQAVAPFKMYLDVADNQTALNDWLLVDDGTGGTVRQIAKVTGVSMGVATIDRLPAALNTDVFYWLPTASIAGSIHPALQLGPGNSGWDIAVLDRRADLYFPALDPKRQHVIAVAPDAVVPTHPQWLAFESALMAAPTGSIKFVVDGALTGWLRLLGDTSSNPALAWEYWNGTGWWRLEIDQDQTNNLKNSGPVTFKVPADLQPVDWAGKTNHWIRARLIGGDYGHETIVVKTKPVGTGTEQTVERSTEGIQPPYALNVFVRYSIDGGVLPTFLLTQDSGTLRNQSDANRTPDALIEVFTPLIYALRRFEAPTLAVASKTTEECVPDCECASGIASTSPAKKLAAPASTTIAPSPVSRADRRALYLGMDSKLSGEPINMLLVVAEERSHDTLAPLTVEALLADRFVPVVAKDGTRAIGESGLVSMSFSVEPIPVELFGKSLSWLRLTPGDAAIKWEPTLRGAYLNAVWARAAETMTRELVGSSEGAPNLALQLARPPLLKDSLELRVKEALGEEERDLLVEGEPDKVRSEVTDLPGHWVLWTQVPDPVDHEATARVYSLDEDTGVIRFGDGQHGAIPPIGADVIVAFRYERTDPANSEGVPANFVPARSPLSLVTPVESVEAAIAADQAVGGFAPESSERVLRFGATKLRHRGRAVTARDFEDLALARFADVVQARCLVRGGSVRLIVVMRGVEPKPSQSQRRELRRMLLAAAPAALAAPGALRIEGPTVRRLRIQLQLRVSTLDVAGDLASHAKRTLQAFFDTDTGGEGHDGWALGASPREDDIAEALLDAPHLESIASITLSEIDQMGGEQLWPQAIKASELAMLASDGIRIAFEIVEAVE